MEVWLDRVAVFEYRCSVDRRESVGVVMVLETTYRVEKSLMKESLC